MKCASKTTRTFFKEITLVYYEAWGFLLIRLLKNRYLSDKAFIMLQDLIRLDKRNVDTLIANGTRSYFPFQTYKSNFKIIQKSFLTKVFKTKLLYCKRCICRICITSWSSSDFFYYTDNYFINILHKPA